MHYLLQILPLVQERIDTLADFVPYAGFFFAGAVDYDPQALPKMVAKGRTAPQTAKAFRLLLEDHLDCHGNVERRNHRGGPTIILRRQ